MERAGKPAVLSRKPKRFRKNLGLRIAAPILTFNLSKKVLFN